MKFEQKLKEKIEETYQQIQAIVKQEGQEMPTSDEDSSLSIEEKLSKMEEVLEKK